MWVGKYKTVEILQKMWIIPRGPCSMCPMWARELWRLHILHGMRRKITRGSKIDERKSS